MVELFTPSTQRVQPDNPMSFVEISERLLCSGEEHTTLDSSQSTSFTNKEP